MIALVLATALTLPQALDNARELETMMTDCGLGVKFRCNEMLNDEYEDRLNDLVIFQRSFEPSSDEERDEFNEAVRLSNGMGFTDSDIFIPPPLVVECQLLDGQKVAGTAILNFNKKHRSWGWKAISLDTSPGSSL